MRPYSEQTAQVIDRAIRQIVDECYTKAVDLLTRERGRLEALAAVLLREESLNEAQMRTAAGLEGRPAPERALAVAADRCVAATWTTMSSACVADGRTMMERTTPYQFV
jgi:hypothetical protein